MLTLEDCLGLCDLTEQEVLAIAHHEHVPEMAALELGNYLVHTPEGEMRIKAIILDDIPAARGAGQAAGEVSLKVVPRNFVVQPPYWHWRLRGRDQLPERR